MAYNPYAVANTLTNLEQSRLKAIQQGKEADVEVGKQKSKMYDEYMADVKEAERRAEEALAKQYKGKKGIGFLGQLVSMINPIAGAVVGGITAASEGKRRGKHDVGQAKQAKELAMSIDPRWGKTFLGRGEGGSRDYLSRVESGYGDLISQAQSRADKLGSLSGMAATGLQAGIGDYAFGTSFKDVMGTLKAGKGIAGGGFQGTPFQNPTIGPLQEGVARFPGTADVSGLAEQFGTSEDIISKLLGAKSPKGRSLFEALKGFGGDYGSNVQNILGKQVGGGQNIANILQILQGL